MRILLISPQLFLPWASYTARALRNLTHTVTVFEETRLWLDRGSAGLANLLPGTEPWLRRQKEHWIRRRDQKLLQTAATIRPDLIFLLWGKSFSAAFLNRLKAIGKCPLFTWWLDDPFLTPVDNLFPVYDLFFTFDRSYIAPLKKAGARDVRFLPCACDETVYFPQRLSSREQTRYGCEIALVAWNSPERIHTVKALAEFDLKVWGRGWNASKTRKILNGTGRRIVQSERFVPDAETAKIYSAAQIGLNIHSVQTHQAGLNTRAFELLAAGAFQMMDAVPGMEELLEPGKEVVVYRSPEEAAERARYYLNHPREREPIARRGRERALREHTYLHRMKTLTGVFS